MKKEFVAEVLTCFLNKKKKNHTIHTCIYSHYISGKTTTTCLCNSPDDKKPSKPSSSQLGLPDGPRLGAWPCAGFNCWHM